MFRQACLPTSKRNNATTIQEINPYNVHKNDRRTRCQHKNTNSPNQEETDINLSTVQLSESEIKLLSRGLSFVPTPKCVNWKEVQADINEFTRRMSLKEYFHQNNDPPPVPMKFRVLDVRGRGLLQETQKRRSPRHLHQRRRTRHRVFKTLLNKNNLSKEERTALTNLRKRSGI